MGMIRVGFRSVLVAGLVLGAVGVSSVAGQQNKEVHGRKWKPLPELAHIVVTVEKGYNGKPLSNAAVVFHAVRDGENDGNLEVKTDQDGRATLDLIEVGSKVTVQVIAPGFATYAEQVDVDTANKELLVKLQRPRAQVSLYENTDGKSSQRTPGVQERVAPAKKAPAATPDGQQK